MSRILVMDERQRHRRVKELFHAALELAPEQRQAYIEEACGGDTELRDEVLWFIEMDDEESEEIIDRPALERFNLLDAEPDDPSLEPTGTLPERPSVRPAEGRRPSRVGAYQIREVIAEGGSEAVYLATQDGPEQRRVVVRLFTIRSADQLARSRFEVERQRLTHIDHPGIARVLETAETEDGRPYLVIEQVGGEPVTEHCDRRKLTVEQRLQLFAEVCRSTHHLHQRGVMHRRLKPTNVLVSTAQGSQPDIRHPAAPLTRLRGFGLWLEAEGATTALSSIIKDRASGTPTFTAPEITEEGHGPDNDIRSDVYSLGMLLAELLVGRTTLRRPECDTEEGADEERLVLSRRFAALDEQTATLRARSRRLDPAGMVRRLQGDLDDIVARALAGDIEQRYGSAAELAIDVERHLRGLPLLAAVERPGRPGVLRRLLLCLTGGFVVTLVVMIGLLVQSSQQTRQVRAAADRAAREAAVSDQVAQLLTGLLETGCDAVQPKIAELRAGLGDQPGLEARLLLRVGRAFSATGCFTQAEGYLRQSQELTAEVYGSGHQQAQEVRDALRELQRRRARAEQGSSEIDRILGRWLGPPPTATPKAGGS